MGLIRLVKEAKAAGALNGALSDAAKNPRLYRDPGWQARTAHAAVDLIQAVPMPQPLRELLIAMLTNWKTTAAGLGLAFANLLVAALTAGVKPKDAVISAGLALIGTLAKDHNVTGGSVAAPSK